MGPTSVEREVSGPDGSRSPEETETIYGWMTRSPSRRATSQSRWSAQTKWSSGNDRWKCRATAN